MSLFHYKLRETNNKTKPRSITAKTEDAARKEIEKRHPGLDLLSIEEMPKAGAPPKAKPLPHPAKVHPAKTTVAKTPAAKTPAPKVLSKLKNMLFLQHGKCFFCGEALAEKDASIEHLNPLSKGGPKSEDNEVVCHKSLNGTFGNMDLKRKFEFTLKAAGSFKCPK